MKKTKTKLGLTTNTIRILEGSDLNEVVGAGPGRPRSPTANCSGNPTCTSSVHACGEPSAGCGN